MYIKTLKIRNFRKLKEVAIDFQQNTTLFIGANNSGKTSAITAMNLFLNDQKFSHYDFSLTNHLKINELFEAQIEPTEKDFDDIFPAIDLWFNVEDNDIHYVSRLLPTLDWTGGDLGVRLRYEIKDIPKLYSDYNTIRDKIKGKNGLFPKDMMDYIAKNLSSIFEIRRYILDPTQKQQVQNQESLGDALEDNPLINLLKINSIGAQRGLNDEVSDAEQTEKQKLTSLMTAYYRTHLDPNKGEMTADDINALEELLKASETFTSNMRANFKDALNEISKIGYPPFGAPNITINPQLRATDGINHPNALQYETENGLCLPETYNGLGYQNLIFITFKMIGFRDSWIKYGKSKSDEAVYAPIHLVLIEEPEAHLHPQAQQVFIKKAYDILTDRVEINTSRLTTQMIISTHSPHITHECDFSNLRYFKRSEQSITDIVNLTDVFGNDVATERFTKRYIKINHCDLFFADATILIEGEAERILMPSFIKKLPYLNQSYVSILTIGGSHAHRLKPLIEKLCIPTLIITDRDGIVGGKTTNPTIKLWFPQKEDVNDLLALTLSDKIKTEQYPICVVYQTGDNECTFEDTLKNENKALTKDVKGDKAKFALNLLYLEKFDDAIDGLKTPKYIEDGLAWLNEILGNKMK
jgi:predicted ATP-dependent endonuclease of OLD family